MIDCLLKSMLLVAVVAVVGCHRDPASSGKPEVINTTDNFHFRLGGVDDLDTTIVYYWKMDGSSANIDQSSSIQGGQVLVIIEDSTRVQVYQTDLRDNGSFTSSFGVSGYWRIRFNFSNFKGLVDFRAQRK